MKCRFCVILLLLFTAVPIQSAMARRGDPDLQRAPATMPAPADVKWLTSVDQGYKEAAKYDRPMMVIYGAEWCAPCRALAAQLEKPEIHSKLTGWTLVHVDVDKPEAGAAAYAGPIPALRLLSSQGKPLASREGYLDGGDLLKWMHESVPASVPVDPDLAGDGAPDAAALQRLVARLSSADAAEREAATSRLAPWPAAAAPGVAESFAKGNLRTRLAAMELLSDWKAPVAGIDPWQPETINPARIEAIRKWASSIKPPATQSAGLDAEHLQGAERDIASLLASTDPAEAGIIATRLARIGPPLLPTVVAKEKDAATDRQRERLTALRYRLVAAGGLSQQWPGGLDRLAATDAQTRHVAAEELSSRATIEDMPLLLELFSDPDPLVREISLAALQKVGGKEGTAALVKLLHDPVPNVRAAVLKQLGESPSPEAADAVIAYLAGEKDNDLVVHSVRVLKAAGTENAGKCLVGLLDHESWRVRAEAIDALADMAQTNRGTPNEAAAAGVAKHLDDPDSFVAGRAIAALKPLGSGLAGSVLDDLAAHHPELASDILKLLTADRQVSAKHLDLIRKLCAAANPSVRGQAIIALAEIVQLDCEKELLAALEDKDDSVRISGAKALFTVMHVSLPADGFIEKPSFLGFGGGRTKVNTDIWLTDFRAGKGRPPMFDRMLPDLQKMAKSASKPEQQAAALPLIVLGHDDEAMPIVLAAAKGDEDSRISASGALPWLPWEKRLALFKSIAEPEPNDHLLDELTGNLTVMRDVRAADLLWNQLGANRSSSVANTLYRALQTLYFNEEYPSGNELPPDVLKPALEASRERIKTGSEWQKTIALALMLAHAKDEAKNESKKMLDNEKTPATLRATAFQIYLRAADQPDAEKFAVDALPAGKFSPALQQTAIAYLARGGSELYSLENGFWLPFDSAAVVESYGSGQIRKIRIPAGLKPEPLLPFLQSDNHVLAAHAGYLLCLLGKAEGLPPVLRYWKEQKDSGREIDELVYTAITALDDDSQTPVLEQIYTLIAKQSPYTVRQMYWTIRAMHGPNVLALRKKMRTESGPQVVE